MSNLDLQNAKQLLDNDGYTCVLCKGDSIRTTTARGVKPLATWQQSGENFTGYSAADKVVGKATAFLYCLLGVKAVFAHVMSQSALDVLRSHDIDAECNALVTNIINRRGDGICPFEEAVLDICDPNAALAAIHQKMAQMGIQI